MKRAQYPIRSVVRVETEDTFGFDIAYVLNDGTVAKAKLRPNQHAMKFLRSVQPHHAPTIEIAAHNHELLKTETHDHEIHGVCVYFEKGDVVPYTTKTIAHKNCSIGHDDRGAFLNLEVEQPEGDDTPPAKIHIRPDEPLWPKVTFAEGIEDPEVDLRIVDANPLHWGVKDFDILAVRLPMRWHASLHETHASEPAIGN